MLVRDLVCAAAGWTLAAFVWFAAGRIPRSFLSDEVGAEGLPRGLALLLAAISTLIALRALWARHRDRAPRVAAERGPGVRAHLQALGVAGLGALYVIAAPWLGFPVSVALLLFATAFYYGAPARWPLALIAAAGGAFFWALFARALGVSMPEPGLLRLFG